MRRRSYERCAECASGQLVIGSRAQTPPANLCADSTSCCWILRRLLRLVPGARLVDRAMLSVLDLELGKLGTVVLDGQGK